MEVKNLAELLQEVGVTENELKWKDIKAVLREKRWSKERAELWALWNKAI